MEFKTIHTKYGLSAMSSAEATGTPINLTHMAVGDGNGNPVEPDWEQTQLVRERYRSTINRVYQDPVDATRFTAELVVPASEGGWTMRELAVFDAAGSMFVVGNLPEVYKPLPEEGSFGDAVLRLAFVVTNAAVVTVMVDPNAAVASQAWVINNMTAATVIPGGTVGQLLGKASNADGDYEWKNPAAISVTVDTIAEKQLLAAGQTIVDLSATTTYGLAVYIDGLRIDMGSGAGEWQPDASISTRLTLGQSYPAGTRITLVNNEPAGSAPAPLERDKNLSDLRNKVTARSNLGVYSKAEVDAKVPPGAVLHFASSTAPPGWLKANGAAISRTAYAGLYAAIGTTFGAGDGFTTFNLPDLRGEFIRGWDDSRGVDGGRTLGSQQSGAIERHSHSGSSASAGGHSHTGSAQQAGDHNHSATSVSAGAHTHAASSGSAGGHTHTASSGSAGAHTHTASSGSAGAHTHAASSESTGGHTHTASTGNDSHSHTWSGTTSSSGSHSHTSKAISADSLDPTGGPYIVSSDPVFGAVDDSIETSSAGAHTHTVSGTTSSDSHSHAVTVTSAGAHSHAVTVTSDGAHSHAVTVTSASDHSHAVTVTSAGAHSHTVTVTSGGAHSHGISVGNDGDHTHDLTINSAGSHSHTVTINETGGTETRPRNVALLACIKF